MHQPIIISPALLPQQQEPAQGAEVPPRVKIAMHLLAGLSSKTATQALPTKTFDSEGGPITYEAIPGQKLTVDEQHVMSEACQLLAHYFKGDLKITRWDKPPKVDEKFIKATSTTAPCPVCSNKPDYIRANCNVCHGCGFVNITPAAG